MSVSKVILITGAPRGIDSVPGLVWRSSLAAPLHLVLPLLILYLALEVQAWKVTALMVPDLGYWLEAISAVVFLKGLLEIWLIWRVFRQSHQSRILQPVPG